MAANIKLNKSINVTSTSTVPLSIVLLAIIIAVIVITVTVNSCNCCPPSLRMPHVVLVDSLNINIGFEPVPGVMACKLAELHSLKY